MVTQQAQIKITLPLALKEFLESKASRLGLPIAIYVKHLIIKDAECYFFKMGTHDEVYKK